MGGRERAEGEFVDNSNYDGRANYRGVMAVAAVNDQGVQSSYSESGANLWVAAPGGEFCVSTSMPSPRQIVPGFGPQYGNGVTTGDCTTPTTGNPNPEDYTKCMNGTSSATPDVAGVVALMLAANPNLTWRDVRIILAETARKNDAT